MEYTTDFTDKDLLNSDGCQVEYFFEGIRKIGVLTVEEGLVFLCQNDYDGLPCQEKKGFRYSYILDLNDPSKRNYYKERIQKLYKPKSLVGRYLKALVDNAQNTNYKKGEYAKIKRELIGFIECTVDLENSFSAHPYNTSSWELMPEGFEPNQNHTVLGVELVKGEYYIIKASYEWILKFDRIENGKIYDLGTISIGVGGRYYSGSSWGDATSIRSIRVANFSERLWLDKCIAKGKLIPKEEALEGKEFVLPEKWFCVLTEQNASVLLKWADISARLSINGRTYITYQKLWGDSNKDSYIEITFEQFKKYVLKEEKDKHEIKFKLIDGVNSTFVIPDNNTVVDQINKKTDLEFQEPVIIKSIKNKPKLIIINN